MQVCFNCYVLNFYILDQLYTSLHLSTIQFLFLPYVLVHQKLCFTWKFQRTKHSLICRIFYPILVTSINGRFLCLDEKFLLLSDITSCLYHVTEFVVNLEEESSEQSSVVVDLVTDILMSAQRKSQQTTDTEKAVTNQGTELLGMIRNKSLRVDMFMYIC